jgi:hypothetical protein
MWLEGVHYASREWRQSLLVAERAEQRASYGNSSRIASLREAGASLLKAALKRRAMTG